MHSHWVASALFAISLGCIHRGTDAQGVPEAVPARGDGGRSDADPLQLRATGRILYRDGKFEEALALYERALELNPGDAASHAYVATACFKLENFTCAEKGYVSAIAVTSQQSRHDDRSTIPYRSNLGGVYHRLNRFEDAIETFSAAQAIAPNDESLAMNIKATIVDWHKFIMTQEIVATAAAEARRTGVQWTFNASEGEAVKRSRSPVTSPFWDIPNLLRGRNYTERAEVIFKEIVESRELNLLPAALLLLRGALKDAPHFAIGCHLLADVVVRVLDVLGGGSSSAEDQSVEVEQLAKGLFAVDPKWKKRSRVLDDLLASLSEEATAALRGSLPVAASPDTATSGGLGGLWRKFKSKKAAPEGSAAAVDVDVTVFQRHNESAPPKLHVVVVATELKDELKLLHATATALGWELTILGLGEPWRGLGSKVQLLDEYLSDAAGNVEDANTDIVLFLDAYDVLLLRDAGGFDHPAPLGAEGDKPKPKPASSDNGKGLIERFLSMGGADGRPWNGASIVFSAEKTCAPDKGLELLYPSKGPEPGKPFTFVNSGSYVGRVAAVRRMLTEVQADIAQHHTTDGADRFRLDDQRWFNRFYVRNHATFLTLSSNSSGGGGGSEQGAEPLVVPSNIPVVAVDRAGSLFHTLHDVPLEAFQLQSARLTADDEGAEGGGGLGAARGRYDDEASPTKMALLPYSDVSGGRPCLVHGNGNGMDIYMRLSAHLASKGWPPQRAIQQSSMVLRTKYAPKLQQTPAAAGEGFDPAKGHEGHVEL